MSKILKNVYVLLLESINMDMTVHISLLKNNKAHNSFTSNQAFKNWKP